VPKIANVFSVGKKKPIIFSVEQDLSIMCDGNRQEKPILQIRNQDLVVEGRKRVGKGWAESRQRG
jgi:hypothetical protein